MNTDTSLSEMIAASNAAAHQNGIGRGAREIGADLAGADPNPLVFDAAASLDAALATSTRRSSVIDAAAGTVVAFVPGAGHLTFPVVGLPKAATEYLLVRGLWSWLACADDMHTAYAKLLHGEVPRPKVAEVKLTTWRLAIAHALVDATRKTAEPLTLDAAKVKAAELSPAAVRDFKLDPAVIKHWRRISGSVAPSVAALVIPQVAP